MYASRLSTRCSMVVGGCGPLCEEPGAAPVLVALGVRGVADGFKHACREGETEATCTRARVSAHIMLCLCTGRGTERGRERGREHNMHCTRSLGKHVIVHLLCTSLDNVL